MNDSKVVRPAVSDDERHTTLVKRVEQLLNSKAWGVDVVPAEDGKVRVSRKFYGTSIGYGDFISEGVREQLESVPVPGREREALFTVGEDVWEYIPVPAAVVLSPGTGTTVRPWSVLVSAKEFTPTPMTDAEEWELREQVTMFLPDEAMVQIHRGRLTAMVQVVHRMGTQKARETQADVEKAARRMGFSVAHSGARRVNGREYAVRAVIARTA